MQYTADYQKAQQVKRSQREAEFVRQHEAKLKALDEERAALIAQHTDDLEFCQSFLKFIKDEAEQGVEPHEAKYFCEKRPSLEALQCVSSPTLSFQVCLVENSTLPFLVQARPTLSIKSLLGW